MKRKVYKSLEKTSRELRCSFTLVAGQSFVWSPKEGVDNEWVGVIGKSVLSIKETPKDTKYRVLYSPYSAEENQELLNDYFRLNFNLRKLYKTWSKDEHFSKISANFPGIRILREPPLECLISFICSSNNNIKRITKMLSTLKENFGSHLCTVDGIDYYAFPTLDQLTNATEEFLRESGFGYRAKFIVRTVEMLQEKEENWLLNLRGKDREFIQKELCQLFGVGRKVADCVALFSLDCLDVVPVDTHVMKIATRDYGDRFKPTKAKSLTKTVYNEVGDFFRSIHGEHAGWAHTILFCADLAQFKNKKKETKKRKRKASGKGTRKKVKKTNSS